VTSAKYPLPESHREYDLALQQLEAECRGHIKCEQQMKLHIECMQEKIDALQDEFKASVLSAEKFEKQVESLSK
jgi:hypothetical protein